MSSRKNTVNDYAISLDIGNASVGWAAFAPNYHLVRAKGHELIGARLFEPAETAESRRMYRTTRRRLSRRRWRLRLLDALLTLLWRMSILLSWHVESTLGCTLPMKIIPATGMAEFYLTPKIKISVSTRNTQPSTIFVRL